MSNRATNVHLTRRYMISASHRLHSDEMSERENADVYGKCNNPYGHGHNYMIEVTVSGPVDDQTGMVCDLVDLDDFVRSEVVERFDHQNLNLLPEFAKQVPTTRWPKGSRSCHSSPRRRCEGDSKVRRAHVDILRIRLRSDSRPLLLG